MNKWLLIVFGAIFYFCLYTANAQDCWTNKNRILPDTLRLIPTELIVYHSPNPNYPILNYSKDTSNGKYLWKHSTYVISPKEDLEVVGAGSFIWYSAQGWFTNIQYNKQNFADAFNCKNGMLKKGRVYCYKKNYRFGDNLYGGDALWFVLAKDKKGKIYKGMGLIETEAIIKQ